MTLEELKELLPLFVAGSLTEAQRNTVKDALEKYPELAQELRFWEAMKRVGAVDLARIAERHISSEQTVRYAESSLPAGDERLYVESHLQSCDSCREEFELVRQMSEGDVIKESPAAAKSSSGSWLMRMFRPAIVIPVVALMAAVGIFLSTNDEVRKPVAHIPEARESAAVVPPKSPPVKHIALVLQYAGTVRDPQARKKITSVLVLDRATTAVDLTVPVEHSAITDSYVFDLLQPSGKRTTLPDTLQPVHFRNQLDALRLTIDVSAISDFGRYKLRVREILNPRVRGIDPEEYLYEFEVRSR